MCWSRTAARNGNWLIRATLQARAKLHTHRRNVARAISEAQTTMHWGQSLRNRIVRRQWIRCRIARQPIQKSLKSWLRSCRCFVAAPGQLIRFNFLPQSLRAPLLRKQFRTCNTKLSVVHPILQILGSCTSTPKALRLPATNPAPRADYFLMERHAPLAHIHLTLARFCVTTRQCRNVSTS